MTPLLTRNGHVLGAWVFCTEDDYDQAFEVVPPQTILGAGFLMGEPVSTTSRGDKVWRAYVRLPGARFFKALVTHATFNHFYAKLLARESSPKPCEAMLSKENQMPKKTPSNLMEFAAQGGALHPESPIRMRRQPATLAQAQKAGRDYAVRCDKLKREKQEVKVAKAAQALVEARRSLVLAELGRDKAREEIRQANAKAKAAETRVVATRKALDAAIKAASEAVL